MTDLSRYEPIAEAIVRLLHPFAEVVLHDIETSRIVSIHNGFSKRKSGDDSYIRDRRGLKEGPDVHGPFRKRENPGSWIKYVTVKLKDDRGQAVGLLCINLDLTVFDRFTQSMTAFLSTGEDSSDLDVHFEDDWPGRIAAFVQAHLLRVNRSLAGLTRDDRVQLVRELRSAGAFRAKNAPAVVAQVLGVSRATIYNDLSADPNDPQSPSYTGAEPARG